MNITRLLQTIDLDSAVVKFKINREHEDTHTPRRNKDIAEMEALFSAINSWSSDVSRYLINNLCRVTVVDAPRLDMQAINADDILNPVLPLFEDREAEAEAPALAEGASSEDAAKLALVAKLQAITVAPESPLMRPTDVNALLDGELPR